MPQSGHHPAEQAGRDRGSCRRGTEGAGCGHARARIRRPDGHAADILGSVIHETLVRVRYGEVDRMGVVYHANYLAYFETGRTEFLRHLGRSYRAVEEGGMLLVVADAGLRFHRPAGYDDELRVRTRLVELSGVRLGSSTRSTGRPTARSSRRATRPSLRPTRPAGRCACPPRSARSSRGSSRRPPGPRRGRTRPSGASDERDPGDDGAKRRSNDRRPRGHPGGVRTWVPCAARRAADGRGARRGAWRRPRRRGLQDEPPRRGT